MRVGCLQPRSQPVPFQPWRFLGVIAMLMAAGTLAVAGKLRSDDGDARAVITPPVVSEHMSSFDVVDYGGSVMSVAKASNDLSPQDHFEFDRLFRNGAAAR